MNAMQPFFFDGRQVRVVLGEQGEPWFVAKDVCSVLVISDHHQAVARLDEDERGRCIVPTPSGAQEMTAVSESGLYALIFTSRKPEAKAFRRWVTGTVLPAVRRTGRFEMPHPDMPPLPASLRRLPPAVRRTILHGATQAAKLGNLGSTDVYFHYGRMAELLSAGMSGRMPASEPSMTVWSDEQFQAWAGRCLRYNPGFRVQAKRLWLSFCQWFELESNGMRPSWHMLGRWLRARYDYHDSNKTYYFNIEVVLLKS
ncbi:MAG: Bro-N domain-containing protein [Desulfovibrio sp.]